MTEAAIGDSAMKASVVFSKIERSSPRRTSSDPSE